MATLSICMIVKNEEEVLNRCLDCIKNVADEIVIVDTGSSDNTKNIAKLYTENIYDFTWIDNFAAARNYSFSKATMDYVMWLDADDIIDEQNQAKIKELLKNPGQDTDMFMLKYDVAFDSDNKPTVSYYRERIFKRSNNYKWVGEIHEVIPPNGNIVYEEISICHKKMKPSDPERNLNIFKRMILEGKTLDPRQQFYYARELRNNGYMEQAIEEFNKFLDDGQGWIENNISASCDLSNCYKESGNELMEIISLFRSFIYDLPRAEICCDIGNYFLDRCKYEIAVFWYKLAAEKQYNDKSGGFHFPDCYGFIPNIQMCVCYDKLGDYEKAAYYNDIAATFKPNNESVLFNKKYFEGILNKSPE